MDSQDITINIRIFPYGGVDWITLQEYQGDDSDLDKEISTHNERYGESEYIGSGVYQWSDRDTLALIQLTNMSYYN